MFFPILERQPATSGRARRQALLLAGLLGTGMPAIAAATSAPVSDVPAAERAAAAAPDASADAPSEPRRFYIREFRLVGMKTLSPAEVDAAVYPFMGPLRTEADVDGARAALEKAYRDKGYNTVFVTVPPQSGRRGVIVLEVTEAVVGRVRVKGARYHQPSRILRRTPSLAEGTLPNFNDVLEDITALQSADLSVTPDLRSGVEPGTVDIDLNVKDTLPLHGSLELNNRYSADTTPLRINGSISYGNLWQRGHAAGFSFQIAPENLDDAQVYSGYYMLPVPGVRGLSFMLQGVKQDSNVNTLGGAAVAGRGYVVGGRAIVALPTEKDFYQTLSVGLDFKHFDEEVLLGDTLLSTPVEYYPVSLNYGAAWTRPKSFTEFNSSVVFGLRGLGSDGFEFDAKRYNSDGAFIYWRGDLARTQDLPGGWQAYAKVQGQAAGGPLVNSEQFSGGGLGTVRGYLESTALGDNGIVGSLEVRTPSLLGRKHLPDPENPDKKSSEWRLHAFVEGARLTLNEALPEQNDTFDLASFGVGSRFKLWDTLNGSIDVAFPLIDQPNADRGDATVTFRLWAEF